VATQLLGLLVTLGSVHGSSMVVVGEGTIDSAVRVVRLAGRAQTPAQPDEVLHQLDGGVVLRLEYGRRRLVLILPPPTLK